MKSQLIALLAILAVMGWWLFRARLSRVKSRMGRALRVGGILYLAILAVRLATTPIDQQEMVTFALSLLFFLALWAVAWLITRVLERR